MLLFNSGALGSTIRRVVIKKIALFVVVFMPIFLVINFLNLLLPNVDRQMISVIKAVLGSIVLLTLVTFLFVQMEMVKMQRNIWRANFKNDLFATFLLDEDGRFIKVNKTFKKALGWQNKTYIGQAFTSIFTDEAQKEKNVMHVQLTKEGQSQRYETFLYGADGQLVEIEVMAAPIVIHKKIVGLIGAAIDTTEKNENQRKLSFLANIDGLTGIANRREFDKTLEEEWKRASRNQTCLSLIMFDLDEFKTYNDTYGHLQGDECLKQVASTVQATLKRPSDLVARYGGEEFAVILPDTDWHGAALVAERVRSTIESLNITHKNSTMQQNVTVSVGVASMLPDDTILFPEALLQHADEALYRAKRKGGNQVEVFDGKDNS